MTALKQYERLESGGLWRPEVGAQRREVTVSFGDATLVLSDPAGRPLTHWSLAAIERLNPGERPAMFAPDPDASETVEIDDDLMVDAIEKVRKSIERTRPRPRRLRHLGSVTIALVTLALGIFWLPGALRDQAAAVVPHAKRAEIGAILLGHLQRANGPVCRSQRGTAALARLQVRLFGPDSAGQIVIMPLNSGTAVPLPGNLIVVDAELVQSVDDPAIVAGYAVSAFAAARDMDPISKLLETSPLTVTARLLTTSDIDSATLRSYAATLDRPLPELNASALRAAFDQSSLTSAPFARHAATEAFPLQDLIQNDPVADRETPPLLSDDDWVRIQGICDT